MITKDLISENVKKIAEDFPMCITEIEDKDGNLKKVIDFERLKEVLTGEIRDTEEPYVFTWAGKSKALENAFTSIDINLRPVVEDSVNFYDTNNIYIEGDNLEVLKILQLSYFEKVKMIYIDPPYNTGHDFIYDDDFKQSEEEYDEETGIYDDEENRLYENRESNGRFHSAWCSMIYSRLLLARNLLRPDGVIFISIDDNEVASLRKICDEVFGEDNFVNIITLNLKNNAGVSGGGEDKRLKKNCEFLLFYAKNYNKLPVLNNAFVYTKISNLVQKYRYEERSWKYTSVLVNPGDKKYIASTVDGDGNEIRIYIRENFLIKSINSLILEEKLSESEIYKKYAKSIFSTAMPQSSIRPRVMKKMNELGIYNDIISIEYIPKTGKNKGKIYEQFYKGDKFRLFTWLKDVTEEIKGELYKKDVQGTLWDFVSEINNLTHEGDIAFPNGKKPLKLVKQMLSISTSTPPRKSCVNVPKQPEEGDIILDFFSGSATTAHAVMQLNAEDGGNRRYIMVQIPEKCDEKSEAFKAGYKNICEIGKERIRRAGKKIKEETNADIDYGFKVFKVDSSYLKENIRRPLDEIRQDDLQECIDNIKEDRKPLDLLYAIILDFGKQLTLPVKEEKVGDFTLYNVSNYDMLACFDKNISNEVKEYMAKKEPNFAIFRDSSFKDSVHMTNVAEYFKVVSKETKIYVV